MAHTLALLISSHSAKDGVPLILSACVERMCFNQRFFPLQIQRIIFKYASKAVSDSFRICVFPLFIKMFQPGNFIFGNSDIFPFLRREGKSYKDEIFLLCTTLIGLSCSLLIMQIIFLYACVFGFISLHVYFEKTKTKMRCRGTF